MAQEDINEIVQQRLIIYQLLQRQLEELKNQAQLLEKRFVEIESSKSSINDINGLKQENEILIPVGSGIFAQGRVLNKGQFLVDVGAGVYINANLLKAQEILESRKKELEGINRNLQVEATNIVEKINEIGTELEKLIRVAQKG